MTYEHTDEGHVYEQGGMRIVLQQRDDAKAAEMFAMYTPPQEEPA